MKRVLSIIDNDAYIKNNCFQHQLQIAFDRYAQHSTVSLAGLSMPKGYDVIVSRLKLRTLFQQVDLVASKIKKTPIVVYDQDPWESFHDESPYKGAYDLIASRLNVITFATTSAWWVDLISSKGIPATFVRMWMLPEYCQSSISLEKRTNIGFIGTLHPRRKKLIDELAKRNINVNVVPGNLDYQSFLQKLETLKVFIHNENQPYTVDCMPANIGTGLWVKDIEAAARGCYSVRDNQHGALSYHIDQIGSIKLYDTFDDIEHILRAIDPINSSRAIELIQDLNCWKETVETIIETPGV